MFILALHFPVKAKQLASKPPQFKLSDWSALVFENNINSGKFRPKTDAKPNVVKKSISTFI
jgi:hypothetical protein